MVRKVKLPTKEEREATGKRAYHKSTKTLAQEHLREKRSRAKKEERQLAVKLDNARRKKAKVNTQLKKIDNVSKKGGVLEDEDLKSKRIKDYIEESGEFEVIASPNPGPQTEFLTAAEEEVLYGGAAGGGKSFACLLEATRYVHRPRCRVLILRRTLDELQELLRDAMLVYSKAFPEAKYFKSEKKWQFGSGATIEFSYLDSDEDVSRYQGQSYTLIIFDEITHWPSPYPYDYLRSRLRTTDKEIKLYMRATSNPGGPGTWWVRKYFGIDDVEWGQAFWAKDIETGKVLRYPPSHAKAGQPIMRRRFIPARLKDNPFLAEDGIYESNLLTLPETERKRLLEGDWDAVDDAAFPEFDGQIHIYDPQETFENSRPPRGWFRVRSADYGYSSPSCVLWGAIDQNSTLWIYRELYVKGKTPEELGAMIADLEKTDPYVQEAVLDESMFNLTGGFAMAEQMNRMVNPQFTPSDRDRPAGKQQIHKRLRVDGEGENATPRLKISKHCKNLIKQLRTIPLGKTNHEDVDTKSEDHAYDALRYMCMLRPVESPNPLYHRFGMNARLELRPKMLDPVFGY